MEVEEWKSENGSGRIEVGGRMWEEESRRSSKKCDMVRMSERTPICPVWSVVDKVEIARRK
jgi:hypothetical protein